MGKWNDSSSAPTPSPCVAHPLRQFSATSRNANNENDDGLAYCEGFSRQFPDKQKQINLMMELKCIRIFHMLFVCVSVSVCAEEIFDFPKWCQFRNELKYVIPNWFTDPLNTFRKYWLNLIERLIMCDPPLYTCLALHYGSSHFPPHTHLSWPNL